MRAGSLNKRVTLQYPTSVSDLMGGFTTTWTTGEKIVWAAIWPTSANELVRSMQTVMEITHRIRIRYRVGVLPSWRIKFGTRYFNIVSIVNPNEKNELLDLMCREAV